MSTTLTGSTATPPAPGPAPVTAAGTGNPCIPCDIPAFCRNEYYRGKLLTERDFADEQRYFVDKHRLHALALHGWGVVCGLEVRPHPVCPQLRLVIGPGLAIDACGREVRVLEDTWIELPQPQSSPPQPPHPGPRPYETGQPANGDHNHDDRHDGDDHDRRDDDCPPPIPARTLYLCIAYTECETEYAPAPFDECGCNIGGLKPNRVCEGFRLELYDTKPSFWDDAVGMECDADECWDYYEEGRHHCRPPGGACCIPLAVIMDVIPGQPVCDEQIRIRHHRRWLASTGTLDRVVRCILGKLPAERLTRIDDTNWEHHRRYLCRDFMSEFVGTHEHPRGFRISFTERVRADTINPRTFQALVVFRPDDPALPHHMEIAPAEIHHDEGDTSWCRLMIHPVYARNRLDMREFDLFITLKCDFVVDQRGRAVDGDFLGGHFLTGDHIPGGTFESWIRVRSHRNPV